MNPIVDIPLGKLRVMISSVSGPKDCQNNKQSKLVTCEQNYVFTLYFMLQKQWHSKINPQKYQWMSEVTHNDRNGVIVVYLQLRQITQFMCGSHQYPTTSRPRTYGKFAVGNGGQFQQLPLNQDISLG